MIEALGWVSTGLVLCGYLLNATQRTRWAMIAWIIGDIGWITYDFYIDNFSHLVLSLIIIFINLYGIWNLLSAKKKSNQG